jgi:hypothetical protein
MPFARRGAIARYGMPLATRVLFQTCMNPQMAETLKIAILKDQNDKSHIIVQVH